MSKLNNSLNWKEIINKYKNYDGTVKDFCKKHMITEGQFYHYKKKYKYFNTPTLHPIKLDKVNDEESKESIPKEHHYSNNIIVEIGNAKVHIPSDNTVIISNTIKELIHLC